WVHVLERGVPQDPGVVDDDVDAAPGVERRLHDGPAALGGGDRVVVGHGLAAGGLDLVDHLLGRRRAAAGAVHRAAEVVDHHVGAPPGELEGVGPAEAATRTGDDRDLA